ncbi:hypothetical protein LX36DRAFT_346558 [Colletotrichum falcatum]|nr:hypothetical protein LX36DRAFT_346558 [Colletotrichum falcatum]
MTRCHGRRGGIEKRSALAPSPSASGQQTERPPERVPASQLEQGERKSLGNAKCARHQGPIDAAAAPACANRMPRHITAWRRPRRAWVAFSQPRGFWTQDAGRWDQMPWAWRDSFPAWLLFCAQYHVYRMEVFPGFAKDPRSSISSSSGRTN